MFSPPSLLHDGATEDTVSSDLCFVAPRLAFVSNSTVGMTGYRPDFVRLHFVSPRLRRAGSVISTTTLWGCKAFDSVNMLCGLPRSGMATVPVTHSLRITIAKSNFMAFVERIANGALVPQLA